MAFKISQFLSGIFIPYFSMDYEMFFYADFHLVYYLPFIVRLQIWEPIFDVLNSIMR